MPEDEDEYRGEWEAGRLVPWRLTFALDHRRLFGPEVDQACHAKHPDVDRWEAGTLYPQWHQLVALAELTQFPVKFFFQQAKGIDVRDTSMVFHVKEKDLPSAPVESYPDEVVQATVSQGTLF